MSLWPDLAGVGPGVCMNPFVFTHQVSSLEALWAKRALEGSLAGVRYPVVEDHLAASGEVGAAHLTLEWFLASVNLEPKSVLQSTAPQSSKVLALP